MSGIAGAETSLLEVSPTASKKTYGKKKKSERKRLDLFLPIRWKNHVVMAVGVLHSNKQTHLLHSDSYVKELA